MEIEARFERPGFYLAVSDHALGGSDGGLSPAITAAVLGAPVVLLIRLLLATRRWRAAR